MSYGPFSKTVYANFTETKNISEILRGKEVTLPSLRERLLRILPLASPESYAVIRNKIAEVAAELKTRTPFVSKFKGKLFSPSCMYYKRAVLVDSRSNKQAE